MAATEQPTYQPISCDFHDLLEELATTRRQSRIRFVGDDAAVQQRHDHVADVYSRDGAEYLLLGSGERVRLDRLLSVDEWRLSDFG